MVWLRKLVRRLTGRSHTNRDSRAGFGHSDPIIAGKLFVDAIEIPVVRHCNLSCRSCTHLSPLSKAHSLCVTEFSKDLEILSRFLHAREVRLLGGEPLLHPQLLEIIRIVRSSGITGRISLITNGVLLHRASEELWQAIDELVVSLYPDHHWTPVCASTCERLAQKHGVKLETRCFDRFRESYSQIGTRDPALIQRIFRTCQIAHLWRCYTLDAGFLYRCPQSLLIPELCGIDQANPADGDRLRIEDVRNLPDRLQAFFASTIPTSACRYCLGSAGQLFDHEEIDRRTWRAPQQRPTEAMEDFEYLCFLETQHPDAPLLCTRSEASNPDNLHVARTRRLVRKG